MMRRMPAAARPMMIDSFDVLAGSARGAPSCFTDSSERVEPMWRPPGADPEVDRPPRCRASPRTIELTPWGVTRRPNRRLPCRQRSIGGQTPRLLGGTRVSKHSSKAAVAVELLAALPLLPIAAGPVGAKDSQDAERTRVLNYWTKERIANAKPRDFVRDANGKFSMAKPNQGKPGGGGTGLSILGASWTGGGAILKQSGKVLFTMDSGDYIC